MDAAQILVIILSVFLAVFLLLGIFLLFLLIRITKQIKDVTESAQRTVHGFERMVSGVNKVVSPAMVSKTALDLLNKFRERAKKKGE